jgi:hypothetical protein
MVCHSRGCFVPEFATRLYVLSYMGGRGFLDLSLEMQDVFTFYSENRSDYAPGVVVAETTASTAPSIDPNGTVFPFQ